LTYTFTTICVVHDIGGHVFTLGVPALTYLGDIRGGNECSVSLYLVRRFPAGWSDYRGLKWVGRGSGLDVLVSEPSIHVIVEFAVFGRDRSIHISRFPVMCFCIGR